MSRRRIAPISEQTGYRLNAVAAGAVLFVASAAVVVWQNSRLTVLWDASYVLENASRIAAGDVPYRDFPFPYAPLTFALQALVIKLFGRAWWHHVAYAAIACGAASALTFAIARRFVKPLVAFVLCLPLSLLGIYCIFPHPFYDPDACLAVLALITLLHKRRDSLLAGALCVVPLLVKQNIGFAFVGAVVLVFALARCWRTVAGAAIGGAVAAALVAVVFGMDDYVRWTIRFAAARRLPPLSDVMEMFAEPVIWWWAAALVGGAFVMRRWRWPGAALLVAPWLWMVFGPERELNLIRLWPAVIIAAPIIAPRRFTFVILATIGGAFLSQGNWGSTYGIWPLLVLLLAFIIDRVEVAAVVAVLTLAAAWPYVADNERLTYAKWSEGPLRASSLPALRGMRMRGDWLPQFEELVAFTEKNIPRDDAILCLPGEDLFYFATGRHPRVPVLMFDRTVNPYSPAQIAAFPNVRWVIVKRRLQLNGVPFPEEDATLALLGGRLVARLGNYDIYERAGLTAADPNGESGSGDSARPPSSAFGGPRCRGFPCDQPRAALVRQVRPRPLQHHQQAIAEADQKKDVHRQPGEPGHEAAQFEPPEVRHARGASDGGERAFVAVVERAQRLPFDGADDVLGRVLAFLDRRGRDARDALDGGEVADDEGVAMAGNGQIALDQHAPGAVERRAEAARERRGLHAGGPEHGARGDGRVADAHFAVVHARDHGIGDDLDAELAQLRRGLRRE